MLPVLKALIRILPSGLALKLVHTLATRSRRPQVSLGDMAALSRAEKLLYRPGQHHLAYSWGEGPLVVLVHGWNSCAAEMGQLAEAIAAKGFRSVAVDITGHGSSPGSHVDWRHFPDDVAALQRYLRKPVHAYVSHSAGAIGVMAARALHGLRAKKYVSISAPSHPFPLIQVIQKRLNPPEAVMERYRERTARQFKQTWEKLKAGGAYENLSAQHLLFYDRTDTFVPMSEGQRILGWCSNARLTASEGYSHSRIIQAPELAAAVNDFLVAA